MIFPLGGGSTSTGTTASSTAGEGGGGGGDGGGGGKGGGGKGGGGPPQTIRTCSKDPQPGPASFYPNQNLSPGRCGLKSLPVRGKNADKNCNIACYAMSECKAYVLALDGKGRLKCHLKSCEKQEEIKFQKSAISNSSVLTGMHTPCDPANAVATFNTISGVVTPLKEQQKESKESKRERRLLQHNVRGLEEEDEVHGGA